MNLGKTALQVLGTVAPTLLTALGGPFGALAATVLHAALGTNVDEKVVDTTIAGATQDTLLKMKQAELDLQGKLADLGIKEEQLTFDDLASARAMQVATRDPTVDRLAWLIIGGFLVISLAQLVAMIWKPDAIAKIPSQGWLLIGNLAGYLANEAKQAAAFYFGTTAGSQAKDATIASIAKAP